MIQHAGQARVGKMQNRKVAKESKSSPQSRLANVDAQLSDRRSDGHVLQILQRDRRREGGREREIDGCPARPLELRSIQAGVVSFP